MRIGPRSATATVAVIASLAISIAIAAYLDSFVFFLFVPFVPFLFSDRDEGEEIRECPVCGFRTRDGTYDYCPRDGEELRLLYQE